jgi:hypothetical protein
MLYHIETMKKNAYTYESIWLSMKVTRKKKEEKKTHPSIAVNSTNIAVN